jgi:probable rRNA maturation factor
VQTQGLREGEAVAFPMPEAEDEDGSSRSFKVDNCHPTCRVNRRVLRSVALAAMKHEGRTWFQVDLVLLSSDDMRRYNRDFHDDDQSTDHLGFQYEAPPGQIAGDVMLCLDVCAEQAREYKVTFNRELARLAIHGVLHLCGWQDGTPAKRKAMHARENQVLALLDKRKAVATWLEAGAL